MKTDSILQEVLKKIEPPFSEIAIMQESLDEFKKKFQEYLEIEKINAELFVGGSFAKKTLVKKDKYDAGPCYPEDAALLHDLFKKFGKLNRQTGYPVVKIRDRIPIPAHGRMFEKGVGPVCDLRFNIRGFLGDDGADIFGKGYGRLILIFKRRLWSSGIGKRYPRE